MPGRPISILDRIRRALIGAPIHTSKAHHEKLSPLLGLPVFSSDSLSVVAYATEAILAILVLHSVGAMRYQLPITLAIALLIVVIVISYTQIIHAYPKGGGSYIVSTDNLGARPGMVAGAALMIDYILTVAVSISAGVAAFVSAFPHFHALLVPLSMILVFFVALLNLRGVRESGLIFALPTYAFIFAIMCMIIFGMIKGLQSGPVQQAVVGSNIGSESHLLFLFILLRAFSAGCAALTGIEAVSDGVLSFREPAARNAARVLKTLGFLLITMFLGTSYVAQFLPQVALYATKDEKYRTVTSQIAEYAFGSASFGFYFVQVATMAVLVLAANTAFADFPRVASFLARDGYLPRPFSRQGDRMVFHNGIIILAITAAILVWLFHGELDQLLPLYAIGVFTAFTLSQSGMVAHWYKLKTPGWKRSLGINLFGATMTGVVGVIILITKWSEGAWIVAFLLTVIYAMFAATKARYGSMASQLAISGELPKPPSLHRSLLLVPRVHKGIVTALEYALAMDPKTEAVHVTLDDRKLPTMRREWERYGHGVPLTILPSPYRSLIRPVLDYVDELLEKNPDQVITVIVPEAVSTKWYQKLLHENVAAQLKSALAQRKNVVITSVRYFLE